MPPGSTLWPFSPQPRGPRRATLWSLVSSIAKWGQRARDSLGPGGCCGADPEWGLGSGSWSGGPGWGWRQGGWSAPPWPGEDSQWGRGTRWAGAARGPNAPSPGAPKPRLLWRGTRAKWAGPMRGAGWGLALSALDSHRAWLISRSPARPWDAGGAASRGPREPRGPGSAR